MRAHLVSLYILTAVVASQAAAANVPRIPITGLDRIVAVVNNDIVTATELEKRLAQTKKQLAAQKIKAPPEDVLRRQLLERMIVEEIQLEKAAQTGIRVTDPDVDRAIKAIADRNKMTVSALYDTVHDQGLDRSAYRDQIRKQVTIQQLIDREITSRVTVSDSEVRNYLDSAQARSRDDTEYNVSHIYVSVPESAAPDEIAAARKRADKIINSLKGGEDFARAAVTFSQGPNALTGGVLGWKTAAQLPELFVTALKNLSPGDITDVLRGPNGFHILRLNSRRSTSATEESIQQTHVRHILLRPSEIQSLDDTRNRLFQLRQRLLAGEDFATTARTYSEDAVSAVNGGDLGWVGPNQLVPEFERAMQNLNIGDISEPVQTSFGLHLIQVLGRRQQTISGERELDAARRQLHARKADDRYEQWVRQLRDEAYVQYLLDDLQ